MRPPSGSTPWGRQRTSPQAARRCRRGLRGRGRRLGLACGVGCGWLPVKLTASPVRGAGRTGTSNARGRHAPSSRRRRPPTGRRSRHALAGCGRCSCPHRCLTSEELRLDRAAGRFPLANLEGERPAVVAVRKPERRSAGWRAGRSPDGAANTSATMLAVGAAAVDRAGKPGFRATLAAAGATAIMLAITGVGNIPLNRRTMSYPGGRGRAGVGDHPSALGTAPHRPGAARPDRVRLPGRRSTGRRPAARIWVSPDSETGPARRLTAEARRQHVLEAGAREFAVRLLRDPANAASPRIASSGAPAPDRSAPP